MDYHKKRSIPRNRANSSCYSGSNSSQNFIGSQLNSLGGSISSVNYGVIGSLYAEKKSIRISLSADSQASDNKKIS